jgi:DedD protein
MTTPDMPSDPTAEQIELRRKGRQRLVGAVALALAAVVFVPMLLDPEPRRERAEPLLAIPPRNDAPPLPAVMKGTEQAVPAQPPKAAPDASPQPAAAPQPPAAAKTAEPRAAEFKPAATKASPPQPEAKPSRPAPKLEGFAVQVGAFKDESKLAQAREKVAATRIAHYTERLGGSAGELTRLRAGPFPTREAAEKAAAQLKRAGLDVRVVPLP